MPNQPVAVKCGEIQRLVVLFRPTNGTSLLDREFNPAILNPVLNPFAGVSKLFREDHGKTAGRLLARKSNFMLSNGK
jgi:hypothetical protein